MPESIIDVQHICSGYGRSLVLTDVSFTVEREEIFTIIGKSGSGKTTLLKNLLGLSPYLAGRVKVLGTEASDADAVEKNGLRQRMGVLFQRGALLNSMTVGENVGLPLEMFTPLSPEEIKSRVQETLSSVGLGLAYNLKPQQLSGGMIKRAALARAIIRRPEVLFCDEPSSGLDPLTAKGIDELLVKLRDEYKITIVAVTHDLLSIERIADKVLLIKNGVAAFYGFAEEMKKRDNEDLREFFLLTSPAAVS
jgi:phospholipid/cholesterol/gamma-HCH transport system ATP-binding protein